MKIFRKSLRGTLYKRIELNSKGSFRPCLVLSRVEAEKNPQEKGTLYDLNEKDMVKVLDESGKELFKGPASDLKGLQPHFDSQAFAEVLLSQAPTIEENKPTLPNERSQYPILTLALVISALASVAAILFPGQDKFVDERMTVIALTLVLMMIVSGKDLIFGKKNLFNFFRYISSVSLLGYFVIKLV